MKNGLSNSLQGFSPQDAVQLFSVIFSWAVISPIAVVMTGKYLYRILGVEIPGTSDDYFWVPLWPLFRTKASGSEVGFGFTLYTIVFFVIGISWGPQVYQSVKKQLGVDLGTWTSVSIVSAVVVLTATFLVFVIREAFGRRSERNVQRDRIIMRIAGEADDE